MSECILKEDRDGQVTSRPGNEFCSNIIAAYNLLSLNCCHAYL